MMFQLLTLHLWQAAHCTLHSAHCTLHTAPAPANAPASAPVHLILLIVKCTLHAILVYLKLHIYHFTMRTSKICL